MADLTPGRWATALLNRLGIPASPANTKALVGWAQAEGGHWKNQAKFNPLNTTQPAAGAGNTGSQGNIKAYKDWHQGLDATVQTLRNGRYGSVLDALKGNDPEAVARAVGSSPWGTNASLIAKTIGGTSATAPIASQTVRTPAALATSDGSTAARGALISEFLQTRGANPVDLALQLRALKTTTPTVAGPTPGSAGGVTATGDTAELTRRANAISAKKLPYAWGGGHGGKVDAYKAQPLDCSGAVSAVLGINPRVSGQFASWGKPGDGGSQGVTIASNAKHVLMKIDGHWFGTSGSNPGGGAGWIPQTQISPEYLKGFTLRHT